MNFDAVQYLTYCDSTLKGKTIYVFEKDGAPSIPCNLSTPQTLHPRAPSSHLHPSNTQQVADFHFVLLKHHFETCLLWNVVGGGMKQPTGALFTSPH